MSLSIRFYFFYNSNVSTLTHLRCSTSSLKHSTASDSSRDRMVTNTVATASQQADARNRMLKTKFFNDLQGKFGFIDDLAPPEQRRKRSSVYEAYLKQMMDGAAKAVDASAPPNLLSAPPSTRKRSMSLSDLSKLDTRAVSSGGLGDLKEAKKSAKEARDSPARSPSLFSRLRKSLHKSKVEPDNK